MLQSFNSITLYDNIDLVIQQDNEEKAIIEAGENLQPFITTELKDNTLTIRNNSACDWLRSANEKITITLFVKDIDNISYYGAGNISSLNQLQVDDLSIDSWTGAGDIVLNINAQSVRATIHGENADIILKGRAATGTAYCTSRGTIDLRELEVKHLTITQRSVRDAFVNVTESIEAIIMYKGNVYFRGNPSRKEVTTTNEGRLLPL